MAEDILKLIDKAVEEKTFSLEGLSAVQKIKEQAGILQARVDQLTKDLENARRLQEDTKAANNVTAVKLSEAVARQISIETREKKMTDLEKERAVSLAVQNAYEKMFDKIFANRQFRESVIENSTKSHPAGMQNYPMTAPENSNRSTTTEEL